MSRTPEVAKDLNRVRQGMTVDLDRLEKMRALDLPWWLWRDGRIMRVIMRAEHRRLLEEGWRRASDTPGLLISGDRCKADTGWDGEKEWRPFT